MATVKDQLLVVDQETGEKKFTELSFKVDFSDREVDENINFGLYLALMERDEEFEKYHSNPNGVFYFNFPWFNSSQCGSEVYWIETRTVQPNGSKTRYFQIKKPIMEHLKPKVQNRYRAFIFVVPEITCGQAFAEDVCVNYG